MLDPVKVTHRLLEEAAQAFEAQSGALYLERGGRLELTHSFGKWKDGDAQISVPMEDDGKRLGLIQLGARKGGLRYTEKDIEALRQVAGVVAGAIGSGEGAR